MLDRDGARLVRVITAVSAGQEQLKRNRRQRQGDVCDSEVAGDLSD